ncbi:MAG: hypothetical protein ACR2FL_05890 [Nocardioidaceae bacterium]
MRAIGLGGVELPAVVLDGDEQLGVGEIEITVEPEPILKVELDHRAGKSGIDDPETLPRLPR